MIRILNAILLICYLNSNTLIAYHKCYLDHPETKNIKSIENTLQDFDFGESMQTYADSKLGNFRIHYDTTGQNAVSTIDLNQNSIPDYIDSALYYSEDVRQFYLDLGWPEVPKDSVLELVHGGSAAYDIYIQSLNGAYGEAHVLNDFNDFIEKRGSISKIFIHNNFEDPSSFETTGIEGLKITLAHEYHHAIQYTYEDKFNKLSLQTFEMTATYFESKYLEGNKDFYAPLRVSIFKDPDEYSFTSASGADLYAWSIFFKFVEQKFGEGLIKSIWRDNSELNLLERINDFLTGLDTNFPFEWKEFLKWCYYTGDRSRDDYGFENSRDWPQIQYSFVDTILNDKININNYSKNLTFNLKRFTTASFPQRSSDTIDVIVTRVDTSRFAFDKFEDYQYRYEVAPTSFENSIQIENSNYNFLLDGSKFESIHLLNLGSELEEIAYSMPNPFVPNEHSNIKFPLNKNVPLFTQCDVIIYSEELVPIHQSRGQAISNGEFKVVDLPFSDLRLQSGIYFFLTSFNNENRIFGKFTVLE